MITFTCPACATSLTRADKEAGAATACHACGQSLQVPHFQGDNVILLGESTGKADGLVRFPCPHCNRVIKAKPTQAGLRANCPGCKKPFQVPAATASTEPTMIGADNIVAAPEATDTIKFSCPRCTTWIRRNRIEAGQQIACSGCGQLLAIPYSPLPAISSGFTGAAPEPAPMGRLIHPHQSNGLRNVFLGCFAFIFSAIVLLGGIVAVIVFLSRPPSPPSAKDIAALNSSPEMKGRLQAALAVEGNNARDMLLEDIAKDAAAQGDSEVAKLALTQISNSYTKDRRAEHCAKALTSKGNIPGATEIAKMISNSYTRQQVLETIAKTTPVSSVPIVSTPEPKPDPNKVPHDDTGVGTLPPDTGWNDRLPRIRPNDPPPQRETPVCRGCKGTGLSRSACSVCRGSGVDTQSGRFACFACKGKRFDTCIECGGSGKSFR